LVELWKKDLLGSPGVTVFYRLPQEEYDRLLPMTISPASAKIVRVGLVLHPNCEPDLAEVILGLVKQLDDNDFETREAAQKRLDEYGRAAFVHLARIAKKNPSAEVERRIKELLRKYDAREAVPVGEKK
jgi:hypothetical protein